MKNTSSLKKSNEFLKVYKKGKFNAGKYIVLYCLTNGLDENRLGIVITKKIGKSVKRNRIRRLIKENYRLLENEVKVGYDLVFVSRKNQNIPDYRIIQKEIRYIFKRLNLTK